MARRAVVKTVKKKWIPIIAKGYFDGRELGETTVVESSQAVGRRVRLPLASLTGNPRQQQTFLEFTVDEAEGDTARAVWTGWELSSTLVKRIVRRRTSKIDHSFIVKLKDDTLIRVKPMLITASRVATITRSELRKLMTREILERLGQAEREDVLKILLSGELARQIKQKASALAPIKTVEFRVVRVTQRGTPLSLDDIKLSKETLLALRKREQKQQAARKRKQQRADAKAEAEGKNEEEKASEKETPAEEAAEGEAEA